MLTPHTIFQDIRTSFELRRVKRDADKLQAIVNDCMDDGCSAKNMAGKLRAVGVPQDQITALIAAHAAP
jgi:hypothetical protein